MIQSKTFKVELVYNSDFEYFYTEEDFSNINKEDISQLFKELEKDGKGLQINITEIS